MMVQFERSNTRAAEFGEVTARADITSALSGLEACLYTDTDLQKRLNEALNENKKNEATIMRLREQIHQHQAQERSMEAKIIQLSMDLAMSKAEADRQQLRLSQLEQQPQEDTRSTALKPASEEHGGCGAVGVRQNVMSGAIGRLRSTENLRCNSRTHNHLRSKSLTIPSKCAVKMVDVDEETIAKSNGSNNNLFLSMGRRIGHLDSSFRSLRQSVLMGSIHSESSEKIKLASGSMHKSIHSIVTDGPFDCDNNSSIDWADA